MTHQSLERRVLDQHLCGLLVPADLLQRDGSWPEAANLLPDRLLRDTPSDRRKMFSLRLQDFGLSLEDLVDLGDLSPCRLSRGLLGSHHLQSLEIDNNVFKIISTTWNTRISDVVVEFCGAFQSKIYFPPAKLVRSVLNIVAVLTLSTQLSL